jgi:hypothetical protein
MAFLLTISALMGAWGYAVVAGLPVLGQPLSTEFQLGVIFVMLTCLVLWLFDLIHRPPITDELLAIRRELTFETLSVEVAKHKIREVIDGGPTLAAVIEAYEAKLGINAPQPVKSVSPRWWPRKMSFRFLRARFRTRS